MATTFETTDLAAAQRFLRTTYGGLHLTVADGPHQIRLTQYSLGAVQLHHVILRLRGRVHGPPRPTLAIARIVGGTVTCRGPGRRRTHHTAGDVFIAAQPGEAFDAAVTDPDLELTLIDPELLAQVADGAAKRVARTLRFTGEHPLSPAAAALWSSTYDYVRRVIADGPAIDKPMIVASAGRLLAAASLVVFPNTALGEPAAEDRDGPHPAIVRRAVGFVDDNAHRAIGPADIAGAANVSIRALQVAFRRYLDTTPMAYLRRVRLEHAHRELRAADPTTTVHTVAARWGFPNHSRFTALYRSAYGVTPSHTLSRAEAR
ncbi:helix-turn-helix transcriptional regulator [Dactylosporangium sp. CA-139066]|uniref:helix-turn-helix transcriptional regulator n=1 Tax=Dactylosporangium sp. CA-139066 TaxID=3239930 RepID=UPI003D9196D8